MARVRHSTVMALALGVGVEAGIFLSASSAWAGDPGKLARLARITQEAGIQATSSRLAMQTAASTVAIKQAVFNQTQDGVSYNKELLVRSAAKLRNAQQEDRKSRNALTQSAVAQAQSDFDAALSNLKTQQAQLLAARQALTGAKAVYVDARSKNASSYQNFVRARNAFLAERLRK